VPIGANRVKRRQIGCWETNVVVLDAPLLAPVDVGVLLEKRQEERELVDYTGVLFQLRTLRQTRGITPTRCRNYLYFDTARENMLIGKKKQKAF